MFDMQKTRDMQALCKEYRAQIDELEKRPKEVYTLIGQPSDDTEFFRQVAQLVDNAFLLYFFERLKREFVDQFQVMGKDQSEFYRGKLAAINEILTEARAAKKKYQERVTGAV